ncbi:hypothetical protein FRB95_000993 [Tulasnella sp. JGI-2019a]|nr:hypothetical protein FRB95_000993 [Tulasnella sp. JGI-2019a]
MLFTNPQPLPLFPTIQMLHIHMHPQNLEQIPLFTAPSLCEIFIHILGNQVMPKDINQEARLLSCIPTLMPNLANLGYSSDIAGSNLELAKTLASLQSLEIVHLYVANLLDVTNALESLSTLPFLQCLNLTCGEEVITWTSKEGEQVFLSLSSITVKNGGHNAHLPMMIREIAPAKNLCKIHCLGVGQALPDLIEALGMHSGLYDLRLEGESNPLHFPQIFPLSRCTNLRELFISVAG